MKVLVTLILLFTLINIISLQENSTWIGGTGNFNDSQNWEPNSIPDYLNSVIINVDGSNVTADLVPVNVSSIYVDNNSTLYLNYDANISNNVTVTYGSFIISNNSSFTANHVIVEGTFEVNNSSIINTTLDFRYFCLFYTNNMKIINSNVLLDGGITFWRNEVLIDNSRIEVSFENSLEIDNVTVSSSTLIINNSSTIEIMPNGNGSFNNTTIDLYSEGQFISYVDSTFSDNSEINLYDSSQVSLIGNSLISDTSININDMSQLSIQNNNNIFSNISMKSSNSSLNIYKSNLTLNDNEITQGLLDLNQSNVTISSHGFSCNSLNLQVSSLTIGGSNIFVQTDLSTNSIIGTIIISHNQFILYNTEIIIYQKSIVNLNANFNNFTLISSNITFDGNTTIDAPTTVDNLSTIFNYGTYYQSKDINIGSEVSLGLFYNYGTFFPSSQLNTQLISYNNITITEPVIARDLISNGTLDIRSTLTVDSYSQTSTSTLYLTIDGTNSLQPQLIVKGHASFSGDLIIYVSNTNELDLSKSINLISFGSVIGSFTKTKFNINSSCDPSAVIDSTSLSIILCPDSSSSHEEAANQNKKTKVIALTATISVLILALIALVVYRKIKPNDHEHGEKEALIGN